MCHLCHCSVLRAVPNIGKPIKEKGHEMLPRFSSQDYKRVDSTSFLQNRSGVAQLSNTTIRGNGLWPPNAGMARFRQIFCNLVNGKVAHWCVSNREELLQVTECADENELSTKLAWQ